MNDITRERRCNIIYAARRQWQSVYRFIKANKTNVNGYLDINITQLQADTRQWQQIRPANLIRNNIASSNRLQSLQRRRNR